MAEVVMFWVVKYLGAEQLIKKKLQNSGKKVMAQEAFQEGKRKFQLWGEGQKEQLKHQGEREEMIEEPEELIRGKQMQLRELEQVEGN